MPRSFCRHSRGPSSRVFTIRLGIPDMKGLWDDLVRKSGTGNLSKEETALYKKWGKTMAFLANDPKHPSLHSHDIEALSSRYGTKVWQSYLENNTPGAGRLYWVYGPGKGEITVIGLEPHPESQKKGGYDKVKLSGTGNEI